MAFGRLGTIGAGFGHLGASPGGGVAAPVGGAALLVGETDGFAADFTYATDALRVAKKTAGTVVSSGLSFFTNAGTSSKWVFNAAGTLVNVAAGSLAVDYDPVTHAAKGLLVEPAATNQLVRSSEFDNVWGPGANTIGANATTAPDGLNTADALIPNSGSVLAYVTASPTTAGGAVNTLSVFMKNGTLGTNWVRLSALTPTYEVWFNLATGVKGGSTGSPTAYTITALPNNWYRLTLTFTPTSTPTPIYIVAEPADLSSGNVTGNGTSPAFYLWGAQCEAGTVATSHIPTLGATVTRAVDQVSVTTATIGYSATAGSWWADVDAKTAALGNRIVGRQDSYAPLYMNATAFAYYDLQANFTKTVSSVVGSNKVASAFQSADRAITANGLAPSTDTTAGASFSPGTSIGFGYDPNAGTSQMNGYIRKIRYVPRRKTNPELVAETT
jgi:hypothetical protein